MADIIKKSIANEILLLPIRAVTLWDGTDALTLFQIEAESSYQTSPIVRINDEGMPIKVAEKLTATIYIPFNHFEELWMGKLEGMSNKPIQFIIALGESESWTHFADTTLNETLITKAINSSDQSLGGYIQTDMNAYITAEWESVEFRPRMILRVTAIMKSLYNNLHLSNTATATSQNYLLKSTVY